MRLKVLTLHLDPATGAFDDSALQELTRDNDVLWVSDHFFTHEQTPCWTLLVSYRPGGNGKRAAAHGGRRQSTDWRATLAEEEQPLFDALRKWRNDRARQEGKPAYILLTNQQLAELARRRPASAAELREVQGVGDAKAQDLGPDILGLVSAASEAAPAGSFEAPSPGGPARDSSGGAGEQGLA